ncbi:M23 family metallopeptidase [Candidatus Aeolococcus gillhamiae]|uniref:M23 family metallopeptidase n=1 Tax=Candidatus Aeolococcus gillhamiae TaxID=3127015 RepID=UPI003077D85A
MRKVLVGLLAGMLLLIAVPAQAAPGAPPPKSAPTLDPVAAQLQAQLLQQAALKAMVGSLSSELQAARDSQNSLGDLVNANQKAIAETLTQLTAAEQRYSDATSREATERANAAVARRHAKADKQLLAIYVRLGYQTHDSLLSYLLSSASVSDLLSRAADLSHVVHRSSQLVDQINADIAEAESAEAQAAADAVVAQQATAQLQAQEQTLQQQTQHAQDLIGQLSSQAAATAREISAANGQSLAVAQSIAQTRLDQLNVTIAAAEQAAWDEATYYLKNHLGTLPSSIAIPPTTPINADGSQLIWAAHHVGIAQGFGPSPYPFEPAYGGYPHFHTGIDLSGPYGTPIVAAADGVVAAADLSTVGYGNHVILAHAGGLLTLYGHLEAVLVKAGDAVKAGQVIGLLGSTGNSTGPHCHFEVRVNGTPVDPRPFLPALSAGATGP